MQVISPETLSAALDAKATWPDAVPVAGGTDVMVDINFGRVRPAVLLDLTRIEELRGWDADEGWIRIGAGVTYTRVIDELRDRVGGLAAAARTVGSPQIRNRGTVAGNLGTASPAGDALPPLYVSDTEIEIASVRGTRRVPISEFVTGPRRSCLTPDELITACRLRAGGDYQQFAKVGARNAMVIAVCSVAISVAPESRSVKLCLGSAGPRPLRATAAEQFLAGWLDEVGAWESLAPIEAPVRRRVGELAAEAAQPIDDVRGSAAYRRHAVSVVAGRVCGWAWDQYVSEAAR